ncbi:MAG: hypothetical protein ACOX2L_00960 [Anaerolineae bacterium]|jgi:hypothetical protein|nr:hypothetical protein [Chloroflexota bacterium]
MTAENNRAELPRALTPLERQWIWAPWAIASLLVRLRGRVNETMLQAALDKVAQRHPALRARVQYAGAQGATLTPEGAGGPWVQTVPRQSEDHWLRAVADASRQPFDVGARPPIRLLLLDGTRSTDLVILGHALLTDGASLISLARDLLAHLSNPVLPVEPLPAPLPMAEGNLPEEATLGTLARMGINRANGRWEKERMVLDQEDYRSLHRAYWGRARSRVLTAVLEPEQTASLMDRLGQGGLSLQATLAALVGASLPATEGREKLGIVVDLRQRLPQPPAEALGAFTTLLPVTLREDVNRGPWEAARRLQETLAPELETRRLFEQVSTTLATDPTLLEALPFKRLGGTVQPGVPRFARLAAFGRRDDAALAAVRRPGGATPGESALGAVVDVLGDPEGPWERGSLAVDQLVYRPAPPLPLSNLLLNVGAVAVNGRLSITLEAAEAVLDAAALEGVRERLLASLS